MEFLYEYDFDTKYIKGKEKKLVDALSRRVHELHATTNNMYQPDLRKWRNYLMGKRFELRTNHNVMKYLFDQPTLNVRQSRWLEFLSEYDFDIKNIKWKENKVVDALNRRVHELHDIAISMYQSDLKDRISKAAKSDLQYMEIITKLQQGILQEKIEDYKLENDEILMYRGIIYVPNSQELKNMILR